ncbi:unnamed protein product [Protopolystoma xenopodis]|uniref:PDZ domain-containing protein n=1 Tax=Protopolystoma xenopodis TaxID=117903 RepID=A0A448XN83_9PLAT|nr:unnamed protein product [Protopolystoma xenopodis]
MAGLQQSDHVVAINGVPTMGMPHARAVQIIDYASYILTITVSRYEKQLRIETFYLDNYALRSQQEPQEIATTELQLVWEKENTPVPEPEPEPMLVWEKENTPVPELEPEPMVIPSDPGITPISIHCLMREYEVPPIDPALKSKYN